MEPNPFQELVAALLDPNSPFAVLFDPKQLAALTSLPLIAQWVKKVVALVPAWNTSAGKVTGVLVGLSAAALVVWSGVQANLPAVTLVSQSLVAFGWVEFIYRTITKKAAASPNPLVP